MKRQRVLIATFALMAMLCTAIMVFAEKAPESKDEADHVMTAEVKAVYSRTVKFDYFDTERERVEYVVELDIKEVHKGDRAKAGQRFYVHCFEVTPIKDEQGRKSGIIGMNGHSAVPQAGQTIKAYSRQSYSQDSGLYPDWFEVVSNREQRK